MYGKMEETQKQVVILGGGIAGLVCARELGRLGLGSLIIEKAPYLGGRVAGFACKATVQCQRCGACLLEDILEEVHRCESIGIIVRADVASIHRQNGAFRVVVSQRPARIRPELCSECGECIVSCPEPGALVRSPRDYQPVINEELCRFYGGGACRNCVESCPEGAIDLDGKPEELSIDAGSVVSAVGFQPFDPNEKPRLGYGRVTGVVTALELDSMLRNDNFAPSAENGGMRSVAFIQCVGSRDPRIGRNYCSTVCCGYALRMARLLRHRFPSVEPTMFYMDIQTFDRDFEARLREAAAEVDLIRAIPTEVRRGEDGRPALIFQDVNGMRIAESYDLVVLSIGISPPKSVGTLSELLGVGLNGDGFLGRDGEDVATEVEGIFLAGAVQGPRSIEHSVSHAIQAAGEVATYLSSERA